MIEYSKYIYDFLKDLYIKRLPSPVGEGKGVGVRRR